MMKNALFLSVVIMTNLGFSETGTEEVKTCTQATTEYEDILAYAEQDNVQEIYASIEMYENLINITPEELNIQTQMRELVADLEKQIANKKELMAKYCRIEELTQQRDEIQERLDERSEQLIETQIDLVAEAMALNDFNLACMNATNYAYGSCMQYFGKVSVEEVESCGKKWTTWGFLGCLEEKSLQK